jgi:hypothetical protein
MRASGKIGVTVAVLLAPPPQEFGTDDPPKK